MDVPEIDVVAAAQRLADGALLLDVRQPDEYEAVHAVGAVLIPLAEVAARMTELPDDRTICVICRSGARSLRAAEVLRAGGLDAVNVAGGTMAWQDADLPVATGQDQG